MSAGCTGLPYKSQSTLRHAIRDLGTMSTRIYIHFLLFCSLLQALYLTVRLHTQAGILLWLATNTTFDKRGPMFMEYTTCYLFYVIKNVINTPC